MTTPNRKTKRLLQDQKRQKQKRWVKWTGLTLLSITFLGMGGSALYINSKLNHLPKVNAQQLKVYDTSEIQDKDGNVIWKDSSQRIKAIDYNNIPTLIQKGVVAVEDNSFWTAKGFKWWNVIRMFTGALYEKVQSKLPFLPYHEARGLSGLNQQLIKNVYFNGGIGVDVTTRKFQELFLAKQLENNYNKKEIMALYFNNIEYAEGDKGLAAIMMTYFGKTPDQYKERTTQNIAEQAYLVGLGQAPSDYNLYANPEKAEKRKNTVLGVFKEKGLISDKEYTEAKAYKLTDNLQPRFRESEDQRQQNLKYKVYTDAVLANLSDQGYDTKKATLKVKTFLNRETFDHITELSQNPAYYLDGDEQIGLTVTDNNGIVVGMVGGRNTQDELNHATQTGRSSGSSLKPFTAYGPLFQYFGNQYGSGSSFSSAPYTYPETNVVMNNYGGYTYGNVTATYALRMSLNTPVARIADGILGSNRMKTFLSGVGLDVKDTYSSVDAIGLDVSTLQTAAAFGAINNGGVYTEPRFIDSITFIDGTTKTIPAKTHQAMNASTAFVLTQMLRGVPQAGATAPSAEIAGWEGYGAKTGSVALDPSSGAYPKYGLGGSDAWFNAITNGGYNLSIWTGYDQPNNSPQVADDFKGHQMLGRDIMKYLNKTAPSNWTMPGNVRSTGGSGLNATYMITDSKDIDQTDTVALVPDISGNYNVLNGITGAKNSESVPKDWKDSLKHNDIYKLYKDNFDLNKSILDKNLYDKLPN